MKEITLYFLTSLLCSTTIAQQKPSDTLPLTAEYWTFKPQKVAFVSTADGPTMIIQPGAGKVIAKTIDFADGTIEFDVKPTDLSFFFRLKNGDENEGFYLRDRAGQPTAPDAVQYAPTVGGVLLWNLLGHYQTNASFMKDDWNHLKVMVSGAQMRLYINSDKPMLAVDHLEGNPTRGTIGFEGAMRVKNLTVSKDVDGLPPVPGVDPTAYDLRYVRSWAVSDPINTPENIDFSKGFLPTPETNWRILATEQRGLLNLSRAFGKSDSRRLVWLKVKIHSATKQQKKLDFGFVDDVWVYLNGNMAYVDKNSYGKPIAKQPDGRCSVENTSFVLPLETGNNELLIGVANNFYGWGVVARFADMDGLAVTPAPTFDARLVKLPAGVVDAYVGNYLLSGGGSVAVTKVNNTLKLSGKEFPTMLLYPEANAKFFTREYNRQIVFGRDSGAVTNFVIYSDGKPIVDAKRTE